MKSRIRGLPVAVVRAFPVFIAVAVALIAARLVPGGPMIKVPVTIALALGAIWVMTQLARRVDRG